MHAIRRFAAKSYILATLSVVAVAVLLIAAPALAAPRIEIIPSTFDFGWTPDNAKVTAQFTVRNTGQEPVPLREVLPSCGCTTTEFTPSNVGALDETKIALTFNTRGYTNARFRKPARVKLEGDDNDYVATLAGHVADPLGTLVPEGDGIAGFEAGSPTHKKITVINKTGRDITLKVVQPPATWADVSLPGGTIKAGGKADVDVSVEGSLKDTRDTSITIAPADNPDRDRLTLAIRTGTPPAPYRVQPKPEAAKSATKPVAKPAAKPAPKAQPKPASSVTPK